MKMFERYTISDRGSIPRTSTFKYSKAFHPQDGGLFLCWALGIGWPVL